MSNDGTLYIVSTPIGNLKDISLRAIEVLSAVDIIACEDTRRTLILLNNFQIKKTLISYYEYNKVKRTDTIIGYLKSGKSVALVSDAGTPGISDPGCSLIRKVLDLGLPVDVIPGASALTMAVVISGMPTHRFVFEGFLPVKSGARKRILEALKNESRTIVFYESPHRIVRTLEEIRAVMGNRPVAVCRELTKKFQEIRREHVDDALEHFKNNEPKGEFVIVLQHEMIKKERGSYERDSQTRDFIDGGR
ncbi:MAG: 16S rRNA (cytidine(1402)-2'-O)-methyltransferase [Candidatus Omnitrophica bacterium]|nr:16S rRNA (cytidine(1402)-2'-O)-methyltransferase [Candidatus Omnitrophota bacterium]